MPRGGSRGSRGISEAFGRHPGALHRQLGYGKGDPLPPGLVQDIASANLGTHVRGHKVTRLLKQRAVLANNAKQFRH